MFQLRGIFDIRAVLRAQFFDQLLGLGQKAPAQLLLRADERFDQRLPLRELLVERVHRRAADDERRARLVNQDGIHLVHDGEIMPALDLLLLARGHAVVAQIIEAELRVRAVGDVAIVLLAADARRLVVQNHADGQAEKLVNRAHPFRVARGEIIVHRHHVDAAAGERVEINRHGGDERLAFAGGHFGDLAQMLGDAADELHVERDHVPFLRQGAHDDFLAAATGGRRF